MRIINSQVQFMNRSSATEVQRGFEQQCYVLRDDGTMTVNATSIASDKGVERNVIVNLTSALLPLDAYVRIHRGDYVEGCGWFRFSDRSVEADLWNSRLGLTRESVETHGKINGFSGHPIACDILLVAGFDRELGGRQHLQDLFLSSSDHFGAIGPEISPVELEIEYVGVETRETKCGVFETDHWRILPGNTQTGHTHPGEDMWSLKGTLVFIEAAVPDFGNVYELTRFDDQVF